MHLDRTSAEVQVRSDFFVRQTLCDKAKNRMLPGRKTDGASRPRDTFREQRRRRDRIVMQETSAPCGRSCSNQEGLNEYINDTDRCGTLGRLEPSRVGTPLEKNWASLKLQFSDHVITVDQYSPLTLYEPLAKRYG
jgi:hypothetical protein